MRLNIKGFHMIKDNYLKSVTVTIFSHNMWFKIFNKDA